MDLEYDDFITDELTDQCEQVRSIAKKSWLTSASVSLAHLDNVKAKVYNVGLIDPRELKATNLWTKKKVPDLPTEPPLTSGTEQSNTAWGSNTSIPDLVQQHGNSLPKPSRPASAKISGKWARPPSGKKNRPQSAKEPIQIPYSENDVEIENRQGFGVKGAKYDPNGRPPKGISYTSSVGWVGPPAGLKYPDKPSHGNGWKIDFPMDEVEREEKREESVHEEDVPDDMPRPPYTTPVPPTPEPEEKTKRIFELFIGDPYKEDDDFVQSDSEEEEFGPSYTAFQVTSSTPSRIKPMGLAEESKESLRLDLPTAEDDFDEIDEVDTERLLAEAESVTQKLDLKSIINANKHIPQSTSSHMAGAEELTNQRRNTCKPEISPTSKAKARHLVSEIIDENGLEFTKPDLNTDKKEKDIRPGLEHEKSTVKFNEDVRTVSITPRNIGRKVEEMHHGKKKHIPHQVDGFVDLIEVKNRIEPVLSTTKAEFSTPPDRPPPSGSSHYSHTGSQHVSRSRPNSGSRPPSGKVKSVGKSSNEKSKGLDSSYRSYGTTMNLNRPKSAPLNRAPKPLTTVTVDYGEAEEKQEIEEKIKKRKKKGRDEVETVMEAITKTERKLKSEDSNDHKLKGKTDTEKNINDEDAVLSTVIKSEPEKNYYEISRHSSMSDHPELSDTATACANKSFNNSNTSVPVIKTTKTLEFDEVKPKEVTIKSVLDQQALSTKDKDDFVSSLKLRDEGRPKSRVRPASAKPPVSKPATSDHERPGSRLGFVAMAPSKEPRTTTDLKTKKPSRPSSAPIHRQRRPSTNKGENQGNKENISTSNENIGVDKGEELIKEGKDEREKVIDNLLERTKTLLENCDKKLEKEESKSAVEVKKSVRPASAHVGLIARSVRDQRRVKSATTKRPVSTTTTRHKHYASYSQGSTSLKQRKSSGKTRTKVVVTEPCIITSNTPYFQEETEEDLECQELQKNLADRGVNIAAETLQRALYPPSGKSKYYQITADLPKRPSVSLLSHPKVWLPHEYKRLQQAEKSLSRANEIMYLQKKAEERRAKLEAMGPEERKKLKKKGKKGGKKLRKSQSLG